MQFEKDECLLCHLQRQQNSGIFGIRVLFYHNRQLPDGKTTVQVSTDPALLKRALKDITDKYSTDPTVTAPTHLLLFNKIDIKAVTSTHRYD